MLWALDPIEKIAIMYVINDTLFAELLSSVHASYLTWA